MAPTDLEGLTDRLDDIAKAGQTTVCRFGVMLGCWPDGLELSGSVWLVSARP